MRILIVCQTGRETGLGHVSRCRVISCALRQTLSAEIFWLVQCDDDYHPQIEGDDVSYIHHSEMLTVAIKDIVSKRPPKIIIFDLHPKKIPEKMKEMLSSIRRGGVKIIAVDAMGEYLSDLDLLFRPTIVNNVYPVQGGAPVVWGWDCLLLNPPKIFSDWRPGSRVLVLTGGGDPIGLGSSLPRILDSILPLGAEVNWVRGPYAKEPRLARPSRLKFVVHESPDNLDRLMADSQYALTVYGVTFFELMSFGVPTVVFSPYGSKDDEHLSLIQREGIALVGSDEMNSAIKLAELMKDKSLARDISRNVIERTRVSGTTKLVNCIREIAL